MHPAEPKPAAGLAIEAPASDVIVLTRELVDRAVLASRESPRKRMILKLHKTDDALFQRMLNAMQPGTLFRAHRHLHPPKAENFLVLRGRLRVVLFDERGGITAHHDLVPGGETFGLDVEPGVCHTLACLEPDTVILECKQGPYDPVSDKDFPAWAPGEDSPEAGAFLARLLALPAR
jgi:cupin fold WbuC family metalloprotein